VLFIWKKESIDDFVYKRRNILKNIAMSAFAKQGILM